MGSLKGLGEDLPSADQNESSVRGRKRDSSDCGSVKENYCGRDCGGGAGLRMTRGKQKIEAQKRAAERNAKPKGSQIEARDAGLKTVCAVCKAPLANYNQLVDHFGSKHPKETVPPPPSTQ